MIIPLVMGAGVDLGTVFGLVPKTSNYTFNTALSGKMQILVSILTLLGYGAHIP